MIRFELASPMPKSLTELTLSRLGQSLGKVLRLHGSRVVGVRFVTSQNIRQLNRLYRRIDRPTDILSFEPVKAGVPLPGYLGDLAICPSVVFHEARRRGIPSQEELIRVLVHGALHLLGYDHVKKTDELKMFSLQEKVVGMLNKIAI